MLTLGPCSHGVYTSISPSLGEKDTKQETSDKPYD